MITAKDILSVGEADNQIHKPTSFNPTDYEVETWFDNSPAPGSFLPDGQQHPHGGLNPYHDHYIWCKSLLANSPTSIYGKGQRGCQCDHCGARIRYTGVVKHIPTGTFMAMGEDCLNRLSIENKEAFKLKFIRDFAHNMAVHQKKLDARAAFLKAHVGLDVCFDWMEQLTTPALAETAGWNEKRRVGRIAGGKQTVADISAKLTEYGSLSDKQVELCHKILREVTQLMAEPAQPEEKLDMAPTGKVSVVGKVLSTKIVSSMYGDTFKMLLLTESPSKFKLWVTVPSAISGDIENGAKVRLTCTVEPSKDDNTFAFGSRPSKAEVVK